MLAFLQYKATFSSSGLTSVPSSSEHSLDMLFKGSKARKVQTLAAWLERGAAKGCFDCRLKKTYYTFSNSGVDAGF